MDSYSNALIKFVLTHYVDVLYNKLTPEDMKDFCKSAGRKNPLETALIWKCDIDRSLHSLAPKGIWEMACRDMTADMLLHLSRMDKYDDDGERIPHLSFMQRDIVSECILKNCPRVCKETGFGKKPCPNEHIISRMRHFLNKDYVEQHIKNRDELGHFKAREANTLPV